MINLLPSSFTSSFPPSFFQLLIYLSNLGFLYLTELAKTGELDAECTNDMELSENKKH